MKKFILPIAIITALFNSANLSGQGLSAKDNASAFIRPSNVIPHPYALNIKAQRNFEKEFKEVSGESWSEKGDGYRVKFTKNDIRYIVDYDRKGNWVCTMRTYEGSMLPYELRKSVATEFFDYSIVVVTEMKIGKVTAYFVKLEDKTSLKTLRIIDGEIDVVESYNRG